MNIVFKFHLTAMLLLALAAGALLEAAWTRSGRPLYRAAIAVPTAAAVAASLVYPIGAVLSVAQSGEQLTLDGWRYLRHRHPGDLTAISYLSRVVRGTPVIVEATGEPYSHAARVSANTGLPTILGWANHERLWRRDTKARAAIDRRGELVRTVYEGDGPTAGHILAELNVDYVVVGPLERATYPRGNFAKFDQLGRKLIDDYGTALYAIGDSVPAP